MDARVTEFAVAEAKARFSELLARVEAGEELTIKRHGKVIAKLSPALHAGRELTFEDKRKAWEEWFAYRREHNITLGPDLTIKDLIEEGRRF